MDTINGGAGIDTLKIFDETAKDITLPGLSNVEIIEVSGVSAEGVSIDTSANTDVTNLNVVKAAGDVTAAAADSTDVSVSGVVSAKAGAISVDGGKNVTVNDANKNADITIGADTVNKGTVTVTDTKQDLGKIAVDGGTDVTITATSSAADTAGTAGKITVGQGGAASDIPSGNVVIVNNLNSDGTAALTGGKITVTGGKTVSVTVNATDAAKDTKANNGVTIGDVEVTGDGNTTSVSVKQTGSLTQATKAAVGGVTETASVKFGALVKGDSVTVANLTFTAAQDLTGAQVAAAFANLTKNDTQSATGPVKNGIYTDGWGDGLVDWTSGAASGDTVVFTSNTANKNVGNLSATVNNISTKSDVVTVTTISGAAVTADAEKTANTVTYGNVVVNEGDTTSITTVSVDGYKSADLGDTGADLAKLTTLSLANSHGQAAVGTTATQLALTVNNVKDNVTLDAAGVGHNEANVTDLTLTSTGAASKFALTAAAVENLTVDAGVALDVHGSSIGTGNTLQTVTVKGAGAVNLGTVESTSLKSFDASANTGGVTATISANSAEIDGANLKTYTLSQGNDVVTLSSNTVDTNVNLGAGDDSITLANGTTVLSKVIDGGTGTNTLVMAAADAAEASSSTAFSAKIDNFQKLSLEQIQAGDGDLQVNLANMDNISYVISNGAAFSTPGANEVTQITFQNLASGQSVTVAGRTVTATGGDLAAADVATAMSTGVDAGNAVVTGSLTDWTAGTAAGTKVSFTATSAGVVDPISASEALAPFATQTADVTTDGVTAVTETSTVSFVGLIDGESVTIDGLTVAANGGSLTAANVAKAVAGGSVTNAVVSGALSTFSAGTPSGNSIVFSAVGSGDATDLSTTISTTAGVAPTVSNTIQGVAAATEVAEITFGALLKGQSVTVTDGVKSETILAAADMTANEVAAALNDGFVAGSLDDLYNISITNNVATLTAKSAGALTDLYVNTGNTTAAADLGVAVVTAVGFGAKATGTLELTKMANNGTLELTAWGELAKVTMADATGSADSFNIVAKVSMGGYTGFGTVDVAGVETLNITSTDTVLDNNGDGKIDPVDTAGITIKADKATTINVTGNANTNLWLDAATTKVSLIDASKATGSLFAYTLVDSTITIKGGAADDTLYTYGQKDVLQGGAGNDTLVVQAGSNLATLTGGAGNDTFAINGASTNVNNAATITDLSAGDVITFAGATAFTSKGIELDKTAVFQDYANTAIKNLAQGELAWFQFGGNTYIVEDVSGSTTAFQNGADMIVKITGTVDLSTASYNATHNILEIA